MTEVFVIMLTNKSPSSFGEVHKPFIGAVVTKDKLETALNHFKEQNYEVEYEAVFVNNEF